MPAFRVAYQYATPTPKTPDAVTVGVTTIEADDEDDARFKLTGRKDLKNAKNLRITNVEIHPYEN